MSLFLNKMQLKKPQGSSLVNILIVLVVLAVITGLYFQFSSDPESMVDVAKEQLRAIQDGDLNKAFSLTTTSFQQQTKPETFSSFIGGYPILQQHTKASLTEKETTPTTGTVTGTIASADERQMQIDYEFVKENDNWRIQGLRVSPLGLTNNLAADNTGMTIQNIAVSDEADADGYVVKNKSTLDKLASKIYATVQVKAPKAGGKIEATVTELSNGAKIGPSVDDIGQAGNLLKAFAFTRVTNAWAVGEYEVSVKLSSGDAKTLKFQVK